MGQAPEAPDLAPGLQDGLDSGLAESFDRTQAEADGTADRREGPAALVDIRG